MGRTIDARLKRLEKADDAAVPCVFVGREPTDQELAALAERGLACVCLPDNHRDPQEPTREQNQRPA